MKKYKDRSDQWLTKAMEAQTIAEAMSHRHTKHTMLMIAAEYLNLAEIAEGREKWLRPETYMSVSFEDLDADFEDPEQLNLF